MRASEGRPLGLGLYTGLLLAVLAGQLLLEQQARAGPQHEADEESEGHRRRRETRRENDHEKTTTSNKSVEGSPDQSLELSAGASRAVGGKKTEWSKYHATPQFLLAMYLLKNTKMDGESRMAGLAFRIDGDHFISSMIKTQKVAEQIDMNEPPSDKEGAFRFSLPSELDLTQVNTEGWQFYPSWKGTLTDNIGVYKLETHPKSEDKRSAAEIYPNRDQIEWEKSTDASTENCRVLVYSSSEGKDDSTKAGGMVRQFVRIDVSMGKCSDKSLCQFGFPQRGKLCGEVDIGSPVLCGENKNNQRLQYVVSHLQFSKGGCHSQFFGLKVAAYSDQIQKALKANY